jgi:hypothetical protein
MAIEGDENPRPHNIEQQAMANSIIIMELSGKVAWK